MREIGRNFGGVWILALTPKLKKKWRALRPVFLALGGASPQAEYWLRNDAMPDASQKKTALKPKKAGVPPCPLYFLGCRKSGRVQAGSQRRRRSLDLEIPRHGGGLALAPLDIYVSCFLFIYADICTPHMHISLLSPQFDVYW